MDKINKAEKVREKESLNHRLPSVCSMSSQITSTGISRSSKPLFTLTQTRKLPSIYMESILNDQWTETVFYSQKSTSQTGPLVESILVITKRSQIHSLLRHCGVTSHAHGSHHCTSVIKQYNLVSVEKSVSKGCGRAMVTVVYNSQLTASLRLNTNKQISRMPSASVVGWTNTGVSGFKHSAYCQHWPPSALGRIWKDMCHSKHTQLFWQQKVFCCWSSCVERLANISTTVHTLETFTQSLKGHMFRL